MELTIENLRTLAQGGHRQATHRGAMPDRGAGVLHMERGA